MFADDVQITFENQTLSLVDGARDYRVTPGEHTLHIKSRDAEFDTEKSTLKRGENPVVTVEVIDAEIVTKLASDVISRRARSSYPVCVVVALFRHHETTNGEQLFRI